MYRTSRCIIPFIIFVAKSSQRARFFSLNFPMTREEFSERYFVAHAHLQTFVSCERESHAGERENYVIGEIREK